MTPNEFLAYARSDPLEALMLGPTLLVTLDDDDHLSRALVLRGLGIAARVGGTMDEAVNYGEQAVMAAEAAGIDALVVDALVSQAGSLAMAGDTSQALQLLDRAEAIGATSTRALLWFQRGTIFTIAGDNVSALTAYTKALPLFRRAGDTESVGATLHNRGLLHIYSGHLRMAESDLLAARKVHEEEGDNTAIAGVDHNLGLLAWYQGDIPRALSLLQESEERLMRQSGATTPVHPSRCEVLLSAGLFTEAHVLAGRIAANNRRHGLGEHEADALLVAAQAALLMGSNDEARNLARAAAALFESQGRGAWLANAERISIEADYLTGNASPSLRSSALRVATALKRDRHLAGAASARLLAGRIALEVGKTGEGIRDLQDLASVDRGPVELLIQGRMAACLVRMARGERRGAMAAARSGLRLIEDHQAALGASDLRAGIERRGAELGDLGLGLAVEGGDARTVITWMERTRARALRLRPVLSWDDPAQAADLSALRQVSSEARTATGDERAALDRRARALQDSIKSRSHRSKTVDPATRLDGTDLSAALATELDDRTLVEFALVDRAVWAVAIHGNRYSLRSVCEIEEVMREIDSLRFAFRRLARRGGDPTVAREIARRVDSLLFSKIHSEEGPLVVIPTPQIYSTPWSALPSLSDRPVTVAPSAEIWLRRSRSRHVPGPVVVAGGPDLELAESETRAVARVHRTSQVLTPGEATVDRVARSIDGARVAHIACHASFQAENPMFSSLRLADGDLNVYDIERIRRPPSLMVLSACDSGFTETRPGEELLGLSSALLGLGTRSIIASVGLVPDSLSTRDLMVEMHRQLKAGRSPSVALHHAQEAVSGTSEGFVAASSFVCIGAG